MFHDEIVHALHAIFVVWPCFFAPTPFAAGFGASWVHCPAAAKFFNQRSKLLVALVPSFSPSFVPMGAGHFSTV